MKPTDNMQAFIDAIKSDPVCELKRIVKKREYYYKLNSGKEFILSESDWISAPGFDWRSIK